MFTEFSLNKKGAPLLNGAPFLYQEQQNR